MKKAVQDEYKNVSKDDLLVTCDDKATTVHITGLEKSVQSFSAMVSISKS